MKNPIQPETKEFDQLAMFVAAGFLLKRTASLQYKAQTLRKPNRSLARLVVSAVALSRFI